MRSVVSKIVKMGISGKGKRASLALKAASGNARESQERVLAGILEMGRQTVFGREHRFSSINGVPDFQDNVPVCTYETLRPYVERHTRGEADVLFPGKPLFYATTSGTTSEPKKIPITSHYHEHCYNGLTNLWLYSQFQENPGFMNGFDLSMVGKAVEGHTPDGTPYGSLSGQLNAYMPDFVKRFRVVPFDAYDIEDYPSKYYTLLRIAMGVPLRWLVAPNPSTLVELDRFAEQHYEDIVRDVADGSLKGGLDLSSPIRAAVEARLKPDRSRARELEKAVPSDRDVQPRDYWPSLQVVNTWLSGNASMYLEAVRDHYPASTVFREFGYIATEARAGIVLGNQQETSILAGHLLFFEFVHEAELGTSNPTYLPMHELERGETYAIYITTPAGLYRYDMNDLVRVEEYYGQFPMVRFVQKGAGITSLTGEKVSEAQYLKAVDEVLSALGERTRFHIGFADIDSSAYHSFIELDRSPRGVEDQVALRLDNALKAANVEYRAKRDSNRLAPLQVHFLPAGAYGAYKTTRMAAGAREGQFKLVHLQQDSDTLSLFRSLADTSETTS